MRCNKLFFITALLSYIFTIGFFNITLAYWGEYSKIKKCLMPFVIYHDYRYKENHGMPSGWGGDYEFIKFDDNYSVSSYSGTSCIRISYKPQGESKHKWALIFWQDAPHTYDISGTKRLTFYAKGDQGNEAIEFGIGVSGDSAQIRHKFALTTDWKQYVIDLANNDLSKISAIFGWTATLEDNPQGVIFYLDEIIFE